MNAEPDIRSASELRRRGSPGLTATIGNMRVNGMRSAPKRSAIEIEEGPIE
jgi:hypothetical protein